MAARKLPESVAKRMFINVFICMKCNARNKAKYDAVKKGKVKCRKCGSRELRLKAKERRGVKA
ncbi:MAG: 50S ribosomal protein L40e [Candidatus Aenigmatarchaeota archaeon]